MKVAVVGATGLVGTRMLQVLEERNFPITKLFPVASERSVGKTIKFAGKRYKIISLDAAVGKKARCGHFLRRRQYFQRMGAAFC